MSVSQTADRLCQAARRTLRDMSGKATEIENSESPKCIDNPSPPSVVGSSAIHCIAAVSAIPQDHVTCWELGSLQHHITSLYSLTSLGKICLQNSPHWVLFSYHCKVKKKKKLVIVSQGMFVPLTSLEHPGSFFSPTPAGLHQFSYKQQPPK